MKMVTKKIKDRYLSTDTRTGYDIGKIVELTEKELNETPFNVNMQKVDADGDEIYDDDNIKQTHKGDKK